MSFLRGRVRSKRSAVSLLLFVMLFGSTAGPSRAQAPSGRMPGTVQDSSGAAVPGVRGAQRQTIPDTQEQRLKSLEERLRSLEEGMGLLKEDVKAARAAIGTGEAGGGGVGFSPPLPP